MSLPAISTCTCLSTTCLSLYLSVCLSACQPVYLSVSLSVSVCLCLSIIHLLSHYVPHPSHLFLSLLPLCMSLFCSRIVNKLIILLLPFSCAISCGFSSDCSVLITTLCLSIRAVNTLPFVPATSGWPRPERNTPSNSASTLTGRAAWSPSHCKVGLHNQSAARQLSDDLLPSPISSRPCARRGR